MQRLRLFLLKWHRRIGASISLLAIFLAVTGIMLNHTEQLSLDSTPVQSKWLLEHYGIGEIETRSFQLGNSYVSQLEQRQLYWNAQALGDCQGSLLGAVQRDEEAYALCERELLVLSTQGELIERIGGIHGLPTSLRGIAVKDNSLLIRADEAIHSFSIDSLSWSEISADSAPTWSEPTTLPDEIQSAVLSNLILDDINLERVILDMHSGRFWGTAGVIVMDIVAIGIILLALSGVWVWSRAKWRRSHYK